ncbi:triose-phosphate isomerase [Allofrancisella guangzhouensis]|uniref:Triosephosphate isomerase n=1 Tax=Allofrancisella guangzhouensis TaxID=594679 RepID=A0A0A8E2X1_9GAMM|nr:triose-phosphate isomerase [Allofrancisella guangzhouensis]AJC48309.1 triosephosphate isomerase [Allofrancisella guangzhouensis]MBK2026605.1 triose-phosphate isomerase [Allofrancisella guangzhouensis]MBK2044349.1 triose-phosphate isomerase [Allofrancisella guangzhouensis]MBK2045592.1 triose-phosphate isomerase [Allofrancisella guangzhouensis]
MQKLIMGNWKMNGNSQSIRELCYGISKVEYDTSKVSVAVFPSSVYVKEVVSQLRESIGVGLQNVTFYDDGAYTGELSVKMLQDTGCSYVLIGHSERRALFGESDEDVFRKLQKVMDTDVVPVVCIGETLSDREGGILEDVLGTQLGLILENFSVQQLEKLVIAYEPVWAIGTGVVASLEQIQQTHKFIRSLLAKINKDLAKKIKIVYGGSLKAENAKDILSLPDVDGGLIGGASLKASEFNEIISQANKICTE